MSAADVSTDGTRARYEPSVSQPPSPSPRAESREPRAESREPRAGDALRVAAEPYLVAFLVTLALLVFRLPAELRLPGAFNDDGVYLALGRALAEGEGYRNIYLVGSPPQVKFPPGLPAIHALLWLVLGSLERVVVAASLLGTVAAGAGAGIIWWFGRTRLAAGRGALALCAIGPMFVASAIDYWTLPITESWFLLGWGALLPLLAPAEEDRAALGRVALAGAVVAVATLFRTQAITLLPAALVALALRRRWREAAVLGAVAIAPIVAWQLSASRAQASLGRFAAPDDSGYTDWIPSGSPFGVVRALAEALAWNVERYVSAMANHFGSPKWLGMIVLAAFAILSSIGAWRARRARPLLVLSIALALVLLLLWPSPQDRLLFPLLPFMGLLAALAATQLHAKLPAGGRQVALGAAIAAAGLVALRQVELRATWQAGIAGQPVWFRSTSWFLPRNSRAIATVAKWARTEGRADDRVLTNLPSGLWLYTGRATMSGEPNESIVAISVWSVPGDFLRARIRDDGITAIVIDNPQRPLSRDLRILWERCPNGFTNVAAGPWDGFPAVFRVNARDGCLRELLAEPRRA